MWRGGKGNCQFIERCSTKIKFTIFSFQRRINASWTFVFSVHLSDLSNGHTKAKEKPYANIWIRFSTSSLSQSKFSLFYLSLQHNVSPFLTRYIDIDFAFAPSWNYLDAFWCVLVRGPAVSCRLCICSILQNPPLLSLTPWNLQSHAAVLHCQLWHHLVFYTL